MWLELRAWLVAFALTQLIEMPVYRVGAKSWRIGFFASALTHPVVWFVFPQLMSVGMPYWGMVFAAEVFAVLGEALWLRANQVRHPLLWSFLANALSFSIGLALRELTGWV